MSATKPCTVCGGTLTNHSGFAWFHDNGLMLCASADRQAEVYR